jgi:hypothetical protein
VSLLKNFDQSFGDIYSSYGIKLIDHPQYNQFDGEEKIE